MGGAASASGRRVALAGASGLIGRALLPLLLQGGATAHLHLLVRRPLPGLLADGRLIEHTVDFAALPALPPLDDAYIALGTTVKQAGSQAAFRQVDFDAVVNTARAARTAGATRLAVVSALGADKASGVFYNRVKGEMQEAVAALGFEQLVFAQPSLLLGDRAALGQPTRAGEVWATRLLGPVMGLVPRSVRPIQAADVAKAMVAALATGRAGVQVLSSAAMQPVR